MAYVNLIKIAGFPRSGTGFTAKYLESLGFDAGHENSEYQVNVDWHHMPLFFKQFEGIDNGIFHERTLYAVVYRNPIATLNSALTLMNSSFEYMDRYIEQLFQEEFIISPYHYNTKIEKIIARMFCWYSMILRHKEHVTIFEVNDLKDKKLTDKFAEHIGFEIDYDNVKPFDDVSYNSRVTRRSHGNWSWNTLADKVEQGLLANLDSVYKELEKAKFIK